MMTLFYSNCFLSFLPCNKKLKNFQIEIPVLRRQVPKNQEQSIQRQDNHGNDTVGRAVVALTGVNIVQRKNQDIKMMLPFVIAWMVVMLTVFDSLEGQNC